VRCLYLASHPLHAIILLIDLLVHSVGELQSEASEVLPLETNLLSEIVTKGTLTEIVIYFLYSGHKFILFGRSLFIRKAAPTRAVVILLLHPFLPSRNRQAYKIMFLIYIGLRSLIENNLISLDDVVTHSLADGINGHRTSSV
jgi:hypothetical protein